ncbi:MAG: glycine zipper 2TM domain-containing protein [Burkholderiales bacterium]
MKKIHRGIAPALLAAGILALSGCESAPYSSNTANAPAGTSVADQAFIGYGRVEAIDVVQDGTSSSTGTRQIVGAVIGGVAGGALGSQIGSGRGQTAATVVGAVGGAVAGNEVAKRTGSTTHDEDYNVRVRMDNGSYQTVRMENPPGVGVGERVSVYQNAVYRY